MNRQNTASFADQLLNWYQDHGRKHLPWQQNVSAYSVWLSEIMCQQTQVVTVIPYYQRFLAAFPTIQDLAQAEQDQVLGLWSGLGYYSRGRNCHKTAQIICAQYQGVFPNDFEQIIALPGIGRSTAGAILSFAFNKPYPILDGNVRRVLCRYYNIHGYPLQTERQKKLWQLAETLTPDINVGQYTQAIMDLGATLCTRSKPKCHACPLSTQCQALAEETVAQRPTAKPKPRKERRHEHLSVLITTQGTDCLLERRPQTGIWAGMLSLPEFIDDEGLLNFAHEQGIGSPEPIGTALVHRFSHYDLTLTAWHLNLKATSDTVTTNSRQWHSTADIGTLALPAPILTLIKRIL